jgi:hypothetical protein
MSDRTRAWRRAQRERTSRNRIREARAIVGQLLGTPDHKLADYLGCPDGRACPFCHKPFDRAAADREARTEIDEGQE